MDKGGYPYMFHPFYLATQMDTVRMVSAHRPQQAQRALVCLPLRAGGRPGAAAGLVLLLRTGHSRFDIVQESEASPAKL